MGVRIVAKGVNAEPYATEYASPVRRALEGIHFLNGSLEKAARNFAPGNKAQGSVVGTPVIGAGFLKCTGLLNFIQTGLADSRNGTLFVVFRNAVDDGANGNKSMPAGNYRSSGAALPGASGVGFYAGSAVSRVNGVAACAATDGDVSTVVVSTTQVTPLTSWSMSVMTFSDSQLVNRNLTVPYSTTTAMPFIRRVSPDRLRIGSGYSSYPGVCDVAAFQYHSAVLTEAEIQAVYADLKAYVLRQGIAV
jgi:hypothetical protein